MRIPPARSPFFKFLPLISLQSAIVVPFVSLIVGAVGLVGYLSYRSGQESVEKIANQLMLDVGDRTKQNLDSYFAIPKSVVQSNAALLRQKRIDGYDLDMMSQHFVQQISIFPRLSAIAIANENGDFFAVEKPLEKSLIIRKRNATSGDKSFYRYLADQDGQNPVLQETRTNYNPHNDPPSNPWYSQAKNEPDGFWRLVVNLSKGQDQPILHAAYFLPFYNIAGQFQGVSASAIYLTQIGDFLRSLNVVRNGQIFLIERDGLLVATSTDEVPFDGTKRDTLAKNVNVRPRRLSAIQSQNPLTAATAKLLSQQSLELSQIKQPQKLRLWLNDVQYFVQVTPLNGQLDWLMIVVIPESDFTAEIQANLRNTFWLCGFALIASIGIGFWISRRIARSLSHLTKATQTFSKDRLTQDLPRSRINEVESLTESFRQMIIEIQAADQLRSHYEHDLERMVAVKTAALTKVQRIAHVGSWEFDVESGVIAWSYEQSRILGFHSSLAIPTYTEFFDMIPLSDRPKLQEAVEGAIICGTSYEIEHGIVRPDGSVCYVISRGSAVSNEQGKVFKLIGTIIDISDRKKVELALQEKETQFKELTAASPSVIYTMVEDRNGIVRFEYISLIAEEIHEVSIAEIYQDAAVIMKQMHPDDLQGYVDAVQMSLENFQPFIHEWRIITPSRKTKWLRVNSRPSHRENGDTVWHGIASDISDRKQLEIDLIITENKVKDILNSTTAAITRLLVKADGTFETDYISAGCELVSGYTADELKADQGLWLSRANPDDWKAVESQVYENIFAKRVGTYVYRLQHKDGSQRWISQTNHSRWDELEKAWIVTIVSTDISDRKQIEIELIEAKEKAEAATKSKSAFLSNMSHEIRTPMNGVLGMAQLLEMTSLDEEQTDFVKTIKESGDALLTIINDILDFSKIESGMLEIEEKVFVLEDTVIAVIKLMESIAIAKQIQLKYAIAPDVPITVIGDRARLRQILLNLVSNAIKFTPQGLVMMTINGEFKELTNNYELKFAIADTGIGIQKEQIDKLFRAFSQADSSISRKYGGTGLGLAISKRLVELMGGTIWVESLGNIGGNPPLDWQSDGQADDQGSIFHFAIAVSIPASKTEIIKQSQDSSSPNSDLSDSQLAINFPLQILLVEDNPVNQMVAKLLLKRLGYQVDLAENGLDAVQATQDQTYDLILMDVQMPKMDGLTATKLIKSRLSNSQTQIVAMTAEAMPEDRQACFDAGMDDYISKPFNISGLIQLFTTVYAQIHPK